MKTICPHCTEINNVPKKESYKKALCGVCKNSLLDNKTINAMISNFDEIIVNSDIPVIVDFWAPWCGPCIQMAPTFTKVALEFPIKTIFVKVNTQDEQSLANRFGIESIPTMIVFKNGIEIQRLSGALNENSMKQFVNTHI